MNLSVEPSGPGPCVLRNHPSKLFVETTTRCNLHCVMCVKQAEGSRIDEGDMAASTFTALEPALPTVEALILSGIGEPLIHSGLEEFISRAKALMPAGSWVGFQSNGLLLNDVRALSLLRSGLDRICLSLDSVSVSTSHRIHGGGHLFAIEHAFAAIAKAKAAVNNKNFQLGIEFVAMPDNLHELPAVLSWAASHGASYAIVTHVLPYAEAKVTDFTYETSSTEAIALFMMWQAKAAADGVDIYRYPSIIWKYAKSSDELRIISFVDRMKAEAEQNGIYLDLKKLFALDLNRLTRTAQTFEQARKTAEYYGLDLKLPELFLQEARKCNFVEEGGMFVAWDGEVCPCYFLWHQYRCYASGWRQFVKQRSFGNLAEKNTLEIWNSPKYRAFRENVIKYDYPYCGSCSLAPCDYIQTDDFEQDCHINAEPCGSCLWCMGIFQCMR